MRERLERHHPAVLEAADGAAAIEIAISKRPDLIFMDITRPVMDGLEATRRLRRESELAHIPVIAVSALAFEENETGAREAGSDGFRSKPVNEEILLEKLVQYLVTR